MKKNLFKIIFIINLLFMNASVVSSQSTTSPDSTNVNLSIKHGIMMPWGDPGFQLYVEGWEPLGVISVYVVDSQGKEITIISEEKEVTTDSDGKVLLDIPYSHGEMASGLCMILVAGKIGVHMLEAEIPKITPPSEQNPKWNLEFINPPDQ